jgi:hypothetical protein
MSKICKRIMLGTKIGAFGNSRRWTQLVSRRWTQLVSVVSVVGTKMPKEHRKGMKSI